MIRERLNKRATQGDIADLAGVSPATVSFVLNDRKDVTLTAATREKVWAAARELGYHPNSAARALRCGRTHAVGFLSPVLGSLLHGHLTRLLHEEVRVQGYDVLLGELSEGRIRGEEDWALPDWSVDGLVINDGFLGGREVTSPPPAAHPPLVSVGWFVHHGLDYVEIDRYAAAVGAMEHLLGAGCRRVAFLMCGEEEQDPAGRSLLPNDHRRRAYEEGLAAAGRPVEWILCPQPSRPSARATVVAHAVRFGLPDAILASNDELALGAYRAAMDLGAGIPQELMIVGCDGLEDTEYLEPPLSTIVTPWDEMIRIGWRFLQQRMHDPSLPQQAARLEARFELRASSDRIGQPGLSCSPVGVQ